MKNERLNFKNLENLQNDNVFVKSELIDLAPLTGLTTRKGLEKALVCEGQIVNIVSNQYGHLPNELFFAEIERKLNEQGVKFVKRSINRDNRSFAVDYILTDESFITKVKNNVDKIVPMLRFVNSYDGSCKTTGTIALYRQVCTNGLHVATTTDMGFAVKHKGDIVNIVLPEINIIANQFMSNEYYHLSKKFEVMAEKTISDLSGFVKLVADTTKIFKFESSEKNPLPSLNARTVIETVQKEASLLGVQPNLWLGYNAFNEILHTKLKKNFEQQANIDTKIFELVADMV